MQNKTITAPNITNLVCVRKTLRYVKYIERAVFPANL